MDAELEQILDSIGPRLRGLRRDRGLTLEALATMTGFSVSTLSRLESGKRRPTLELLIPLARAHRVALDQLVAAPASGDPRVHLQPLRRSHGSVVVPLTQYPGRVQVFKQVLAPREPKLVTHDGYEWLYVLAGELRLILGRSELVLRPGEAAEFDTGEPHWFGPAGVGTVEILHLFGPRGDQAVVRAKPSPAGPRRTRPR
ncbi:XRE family transcriptional regulator [Streptomyces sp. NPDC050856]|uniref:XRE family transcriptional regulator n=1 Tax=Streptomyces sp. NPDC050856 TaxID=3154939 RepID=UPI0033FDE7A7